MSKVTSVTVSCQSCPPCPPSPPCPTPTAQSSPTTLPISESKLGFLVWFWFCGNLFILFHFAVYLFLMIMTMARVLPIAREVEEKRKKNQQEKAAREGKPFIYQSSFASSFLDAWIDFDFKY